MADDESCRVLLKECGISDKNSLSLWTSNKNNLADKDRAGKVKKCADRLKITTAPAPAATKAATKKTAADKPDKSETKSKATPATDVKPKPKPADKATQVPAKGSPASPTPEKPTSSKSAPSSSPLPPRHERKKGALTVSFLPLGKVLRAVQSGMQMYGVALDAIWPIAPALREGEGLHWRSCQLAVRFRHQRLLLPFKPWTESEIVLRLPTGEGDAPTFRNAYGFGVQSFGMTWKAGPTSMLALSKLVASEGDGSQYGGTSLSPASWLDKQRFKAEFRASLGPLRLDLGWKFSHDGDKGFRSGGPSLAVALETLDFSSEGLCVFPTEVVSEPVPSSSSTS
eukprot:jgi/Mesvir1/861/Mv17432-RA.1